MGILLSFLALVLDLVILGVIYWGATTILAKMPFIPQPAKDILIVVIQVIVVIIAVIWAVEWARMALMGAPGWGFPTFIPFRRG